MPLRYRLSLAALLVQAGVAAGQVSGGASAIVLGTLEKPGIEGRTLAEGYVTQPIVMGRATIPSLKLTGDVTLDFEKFTLERGELNAGMYGEGYVDRRHPHTLLHEAVATFATKRVSLSAGKGFVPFGTDDPMSRPLVKYPVNHHLAQVIERALVSGAASSGPIVVEAALFNGDEPESPTDFPNWSRFGDSWASRLTGRMNGYEGQVSFAKVASPEQPNGGGLNAQKLSTSLRFEDARSYALVEFARTREYVNENTAFILYSILAEGKLTRGVSELSLRAERTDRPEEERSANLFRTPRPHSDLSILGRTRWNVLSLNAARSFAKGKMNPFLEIATQHPTSLGSNLGFNPESFYGAKWLWSFSAGVRLGLGMQHMRMGRYGVAVFNSMDHDMMDMEGM